MPTKPFFGIDLALVIELFDDKQALFGLDLALYIEPLTRKKMLDLNEKRAISALFDIFV